MAKHSFRVPMPTKTDKLLLLGENILQKHYQDGSSSPLPPHLMDSLQQLVSIARTEHDRQNELNRQKEKLYEARDLLLGIHESQGSYVKGTVLYIVTAARDILLGHYRGNERVLGDWGYTINSPKGKAQILIPRQADKLMQLAKFLIQKHYQDGSNSLLQSLDWTNLESRLYEAEQKQKEAQAVSREKEKATQLRNIALGMDKGQTTKTANTVHYIVRAVRDLLLGIHRGSEQMLGDWGFEVNFSTVSDSTTTTPTIPTK